MADTETQDLEVIEEQVIQDQEPSEVAKKIAERHAPEAKTEKEQQKEKVSGKTDNEIELTAEAVEEFKELGYEIEDLEQFDAIELKGILTKQLKKENMEVKQPEKPSVPVVSEELAKLDRTGFVKSMVGQPIEKLFEVLNNQAAYIEKLSSQLKETKPVKEKETDSITEEMLEEIDFLELDPKDAVKKINSMIRKALDENNKQWESKLKETIQPVSEVAEKERLKELVGKIQTRLPKEVNAGEIFNEWIKDESMSKEAKLAVAQSEEALITVVANFGKEKHAASENAKKEKDSKKKSKIILAEEVRRKLKEADKIPGENTTINTSRRTDLNNGDSALELKKKIIARHS